MAIIELMSMKHLQARSLDCDWVELGRTVLMLYMLFSRLLFTAYSSGLVSFRMPDTTAGCCAVYKYCETTACQPLQSIKTSLMGAKMQKESIDFSTIGSLMQCTMHLRETKIFLLAKVFQ
jgi:hypothetical protein